MDDRSPGDGDLLEELQGRINQLEITTKQANEELLRRIRGNEDEISENRDRVYQLLGRLNVIEAELEILRDELAELTPTAEE